MRTLEPTIKTRPTTGREALATHAGVIYNETPTIYIQEQALDAILDHFETDLERELGGFLVGGLHEDRGQFIEVRGFVPAVDTKSHAVSLTFTHKTWAAMTRQVEERFSNDLILGWAHTHPNLSVFLSSYDLFIHRHFFTQFWHIALVVDPVHRQLGFFQWRLGDVVSCGFVLVR